MKTRKIAQNVLIIIFIIIFNPLTLHADYSWQKIGTNVGGDVYYVDVSSIKRNGNYVRYLRLTDYYEPNSYGDLSSKIYEETNCTTLSYRYLKDFYFGEPMGNGQSTSVINEVSEWYNNNPNSIGELISEFACNYY